MGRRKWRVVPSEVRRMITSVQSNGLEVRKVELTVSGDIIIGTGKPGEAETSVETNDLDQWMAKNQCA